MVVKCQTILLLALLAWPSLAEADWRATAGVNWRMGCGSRCNTRHYELFWDSWGIEAGAYRIFGKSRLAGIRLDSDPYGYTTRRLGKKGRAVPLGIEAETVHFPAGNTGKGFYYRAGLKLVHHLTVIQGKWRMERYDTGLKYGGGAGYSWRVGAIYSLQAEGRAFFNHGIALHALRYHFMVNLGRWW